MIEDPKGGNPARGRDSLSIDEIIMVAALATIAVGSVALMGWFFYAGPDALVGLFRP